MRVRQALTKEIIFGLGLKASLAFYMIDVREKAFPSPPPPQKGSFLPHGLLREHRIVQHHWNIGCVTESGRKFGKCIMVKLSGVLL